MAEPTLDLGHFRHLLEARRSALTEVDDTARAAAEPVELDQTRQGRLSRMDALQQQAMASAGNRRRATELRQIDGALQRMVDGDYGLCIECGNLIATARLEIDPAVALCIRCAERAES